MGENGDLDDFFVKFFLAAAAAALFAGWRYFGSRAAGGFALWFSSSELAAPPGGRGVEATMLLPLGPAGPPPPGVPKREGITALWGVRAAVPPPRRLDGGGPIFRPGSRTLAAVSCLF